MEDGVSHQMSIKSPWTSLDPLIVFPSTLTDDRRRRRDQEFEWCSVCTEPTGHMHGNPVRWPSLPAENALSLRQTWQMNTQHDAGVFVIWCSLSNGFTADDPGQGRTKCSTPEVRKRFLRGITRRALTSKPFRFQSLNANLFLSVPLTFAPTKLYPFVCDALSKSSQRRLP